MAPVNGSEFPSKGRIRKKVYQINPEFWIGNTVGFFICSGLNLLRKGKLKFGVTKKTFVLVLA